MRILSVALLLSIASVLIFGCIHRKDEYMDSHDLLRQRVMTFYSDLNPKTIWSYFSEKLKQQNNNSELEFNLYFIKNNYFRQYKNMRFQIENIRIHNNNARVTMHFTGEVKDSGNQIDETLFDYWVFENNNWYVDDPNKTN